MNWQLFGDLGIAVMATLVGLVVLGLIAAWIYDQWLKWTGRPR